jgi:hypothetical protein
MTVELWNPTDSRSKASPTDNQRVRLIYQEEKTTVLAGEHPVGCKCRGCGKFRGDLARAWVAVAVTAGLKVPGAEARQPLRAGETELHRRVDAARARIRQFEAGQDQFDWVLVGIETTIADRRGLAYPPGAYQQQSRLDV